MTEKLERFAGSSENPKVEVLLVDYPYTEKVFNQKDIEGLIPLVEGDRLTLCLIRMTEGGETLTMEWTLESESDSMKELNAGGEGVRYKFQVAGNFEPVFSGQMTVLTKEYFHIKDNETSFGETVAQFNNEKEVWEYQ